jgi:hypothetical protein
MHILYSIFNIGPVSQIPLPPKIVDIEALEEIVG